MNKKIPTPILYLIAFGVCLALIPLVWAARSRAARSPSPRLHLIWHLDKQEKFKPQQAHTHFADGRAARLPVEGTVARGELGADDLVKPPLTMPLIRRGQERFDIYCAVCHGPTGDGQGIVHLRAVEKLEAQWVAPAVINRGEKAALTDLEIFEVITNGKAAMPSYASQVPAPDRWAVIAYLRVLQRAHGATLDDLSAQEREQLLSIPYEPPPEEEEPDDQEGQDE